MRLVFLATPGFALPTLKALHEAGNEIVAVYTQPPRPAGRGQKEQPSPVQMYAQEHGLPVFTPTTLKTPDVQKTFAGHKADAAVVVAYGLLLPKPILEAYPLGCINVHPSLLPRWRGAAPIQRTVMAGDKETGVTIMQMNEGLDTGDMLLIEHHPVEEGTTSGMLYAELSEKAAPMVLKVLKGIQDKTIRPVKQPETGVTYAAKLDKRDFPINWNQPSEKIYYQIMGLSPAPGAFFLYKEEAIKVFEATWEKNSNARPGTVIDGRRLGIACNPGILYPTMLQRAGKQRLPVEELLRGFVIPPDSILP
jgi:methionyl-tRNA formyltransferase